VYESGPLRAVHLSRHKWPGGLAYPIELLEEIRLAQRLQLRLRFRGGLVFKAHGLVYHSTLGWRVIKKKTPPAPRATLRGQHMTNH